MLIRTVLIAGLMISGGTCWADECPSTTLNKECLERRDQARLGTYFCFISHMAGIQYPLKNDWPDQSAVPFIGNIKPNTDKFFITIKQSPAYLSCSLLGKDAAGCQKEALANRYIYESKDNTFSGSISSDRTYIFNDITVAFHLYADFKFDAVNLFGNKYIADGKCEKIN